MELTFIVVYFAGLAMFLTPCIIPIVPTYISIISGNIDEIQSGMDKRKFKTLFLTIFFILGFGSAFTLIQVISYKFTNIGMKYLGNSTINMILGALVLLMGLNFLGVFKIPSLYKEKRFFFNFKRSNPLTIFIFGFSFGFGWTPCMGPVLFSILSYLSSSETLVQGIIYIWILTLGLGTPFVVFSILVDSGRKLTWIRENLLFTEKFSGWVLVVMGVILMMDKMSIFLRFGMRDKIIELIKTLFQ